MCGIVGYVGPQNALDVVLEGLRRLEYRGYDSAGVAVRVGGPGSGALASAKKAGKLANLEKVLADAPLPESTNGIGHTRRATHGGPPDRNAHPHLSADGRVLLRPSGTEQLVRVMVEAPTQELADGTARRLAEVVAAVG